jgi:hypothetical protein
MFMLTGGVDIGEAIPANPTEWISTKSWGELNRLGKFKSFRGVVDEVSEKLDFYRGWYDSAHPAEFDLGERWKHLINSNTCAS